MSADLISLDAYSQLPDRYRRRAEEIKRRVDEINRTLVPCRMEAIGDAVIRLRRQFRPQPDTEAASLASEFVAACRDLPEWAVSEAANDFLSGRVDSHTGQFMPTCAEFAKRARHVLVPFLSERSILKDEASKLVERAIDDHSRHLIDMERQDPAVCRRVADLAASIDIAPSKRKGLAHIGLDPEKQKRIDALKRPRQFASKIGHSKPAGEAP